MVLGRAGSHCEACQRPADRDISRWLDVHERWEFDGPARTQSLRRLICLCTDCHGATHFGLAQVQGRDDQARAHLMWVRSESSAAISSQVAAAFDAWKARSLVDWTLDLSILTDGGVSVRNAPVVGDRRRVAAEALAKARPATQ
jgi:hypothetical protein